MKTKQYRDQQQPASTSVPGWKEEGDLQVKTLPMTSKKALQKQELLPRQPQPPEGKRGLRRGKNVNYCLSSITDRNDNNISWVNKGYFNLAENVLSFHKQLPLAIWYMRHLLFSAQLLTSLSFPADSWLEEDRQEKSNHLLAVVF